MSRQMLRRAEPTRSMGVDGELRHTPEDERYHTNLRISRIDSEVNSTKNTAARPRNQTIVADVLIIGFEGFNEYRIPLFLLLLIIYIVTCIENLLIISLIWKTPRLHSPMYFLICNLIFCEFVSSTNIDPSVLQNILSGKSVVPYIGCLVQINVVAATLVFETFLLTLMSYDRYLAICHPLRYSALMHNRLCLYFVIGFWLIAVVIAAVCFCLIIKLLYCAPIIIDYFFCEYTAFSIPVCVISNTRDIYIYGWVVSYVLNLPFVLIALSYMCIVIAILRIKSSAGRRKAFSTCSSHLLVVSLYFGIPFVTYLLTFTNTLSVSIYNGLSFIYYLVLPMINPIIYTLRNQDIHKALQASVSNTVLLKYI